MKQSPRQKIMMTIEEVDQVKWSNIPDNFVVFDLETTGLNSARHKILEIGAVRFNKKDYLATGEISTFQCFIKQPKKIPKSATSINGITDEMVSDGDPESEALQRFLEFVGNTPLYAYNVSFDMGFLHTAVARHAAVVPVENETFDILEFIRANLPGLPNYKLTTVAEHLRVPFSGAHRAVADSVMALQVYIHVMQKLTVIGTQSALDEIEKMKREMAEMSPAIQTNNSVSKESLKTLFAWIIVFIVIIFLFSIIK